MTYVSVCAAADSTGKSTTEIRRKSADASRTVDLKSHSASRRASEEDRWRGEGGIVSNAASTRIYHQPSRASLPDSSTYCSRPSILATARNSGTPNGRGARITSAPVGSCSQIDCRAFVCAAVIGVTSQKKANAHSFSISRLVSSVRLLVQLRVVHHCRNNRQRPANASGASKTQSEPSSSAVTARLRLLVTVSAGCCARRQGRLSRP